MPQVRPSLPLNPARMRDSFTPRFGKCSDLRSPLNFWSRHAEKVHQKIEPPRERAPAKVINLMDALRRSVETERGRSPKQQAPSATRGGEAERPKKKKSR